MSGSMKFPSRAAILAGAAALAFAASAASAQDYGNNGEESIQVIAPRFNTHADGQRLNGPLEKISLSTNVPYDDLNLRTWRGAHALKLRVRDAAQTTCTRLAEAYPVYQQTGTNCYKTALQNGELRANSAIRDARDRRYED
ncbi:MAG: UrcA family protein [Proteobacteria bacterium]|nr:UrcA family protein [Pseudomonadota bacterium]